MAGIHDESVVQEAIDATNLENEKVNGAIATDFILSAEIMAISLATVSDQPFVTRAVVLAVVGLALTVLVYGVVALIVKADDVGVKMAADGRTGLGRAIGRLLVTGMPVFLKVLSIVGTAAMIWVGGGIILHGLEEYGLGGPAHWIHAVAEKAGQMMPAAAGTVSWIINAIGSGIAGLVLGALLIPLVNFAKAIAPKKGPAQPQQSH